MIRPVASADRARDAAAQTAAPAGRSSSDIAGARYRPDIDGLRAVAVLLVLAFHVTGRVPGGFVGVDIFFVISGYLIGGLILGELRSGRFSLAGFYERRVRRIFPALLVVLAATTGAAAVVLFPSDFEAYGKSLAAAIFSVANLYFWRSENYFGALDATKPLLHTWSLSVEEQFYLLFPLGLMLLWTHARARLTAITAAAALISLALSAAMVRADPTRAFYLPHSRAWELLLGFLVFLRPLPPLTGRAARNVAAALGAALILGSALMLTGEIPFPGLAAVPACLGAALIIAAGADGPTIIGRALSWRPVVFVGLISYSLYLWHWPLLVLLQQQFVETEPSRTTKLIVGVASFVLAALTWRFVEIPFRRRRARRMKVFTAAGTAMLATALAAGGVVLTAGLPQRFSPATARLASYVDYWRGRADDGRACAITTGRGFQDYDQETCLRRSTTRPNVLILGDSFAGHLWPGFSAVFPERNLMEASAIGCKPTLTPVAHQARPDCVRLMNFILRRYLPQRPVDLVVLSANWQENEIGHVEETVDWLQASGAKVLLVGPPPQYGAPLPWLLARAQQQGRPELVSAHRWAGPEKVDAALAALARRKGVAYASAYRALCDGQACLTTARDGTPLQFDFGHFTRPGSVHFALSVRRSEALEPPPRS